ncbi:MAG: Glycosyl transferase group 1 [Candidatus Nomurabacteria bacterium GW2011_GWF2_35_66]|uniref:Glycosyl transferase group 1 n=1 Tax=Candidatus Yanofskybacteria bacterium GW2011_GWD2_39_48 TaxID=1619031 RepID=A0A0G0P691_9BACT|nr:MAG: Glycosyl transferase group 1 [Candidatus Nomurabacteria bacterium GW2011_GWF2_35_66]KKR23483.1 MAG: Glycosyl transferase group 1 [Candidatus Yanofskybacteria bacterium GW2011_GWD2_39_48]HCT83702.1 glycosyltransferase family 4 protein [Candidatus Margulisiibacteriota bacterium]
MKIAIVHDWLLNLGGAERVLIALHEIFPEAPIYTLFYRKDFTSKYLKTATIRSSFCQKIPLIQRIYPWTSFIFPTAIESLDLSGFDLVISSSIIFAKGIVLKPKTRHICYCYSPTRFLWDLNGSSRKWGILISIYKNLLRLWDHSAVSRVDKFIAISENVKQRIRKYYKQNATVIYPPVSIVHRENIDTQFSNYYLIVSRLYKYKNINIVIDAFNKLNYKLIIVGDGPEYSNLSRIAHENIIILGFVEDDILPSYYKNCRAFIMAQDEDFGLTPIEAMAFGKPVLALRKGGALEIVKEGESGEFFNDPIPEAIADGVRRLEENYANYDPEKIIATTKKFNFERFKKEILEEIKRLC